MNESAGGYAGLAALVWLGPLGLRGRRGSAETKFLAALLTVGAMGAFRLPPVDNILRALPVLNVTDNRRLTLWVAFALTMLGRVGGRPARPRGLRASKLAVGVAGGGGLAWACRRRWRRWPNRRFATGRNGTTRTPRRERSIRTKPRVEPIARSARHSISSRVVSGSRRSSSWLSPGWPSAPGGRLGSAARRPRFWSC